MGNELEMQELDSANKKIHIKGNIEQISYKTEKLEKDNFVKKLFK